MKLALIVLVLYTLVVAGWTAVLMEFYRAPAPPEKLPGAPSSGVYDCEEVDGKTVTCWEFK